MLESGRPVNQRYDVLLVSMVRWQRMDTMFIPAQSFTTMSILQYPHHPSRHLFFVYYQWGSIINGGTIPKPSRTNLGGGFQKCGSEFKYQTRSVLVSGQYIKENKCFFLSGEKYKRMYPRCIPVQSISSTIPAHKSTLGTVADQVHGACGWCGSPVWLCILLSKRGRRWEHLFRIRLAVFPLILQHSHSSCFSSRRAQASLLNYMISTTGNPEKTWQL